MEFKGPEVVRKDEPQKKGFAGREPLADLAKAREPRILVVFCDSQFEQSSKLVNDMRDTFDLPPMTSMTFSSLLSTPGQKGDILLINSLSPSTILEKSEALEVAIREFRRSNPNCAVVIQNLYGTSTPAGHLISELERSGLATVLEGAGTGYHRMIEVGAEALAKNGL